MLSLSKKGILVSIAGVIMGMMSSKSLQAGTVNKIGMQVSWQHQRSFLILTVKGPGRGWVLAGFNNRSGLQNARLFFASVLNGRTRVEEHRTDLHRPAPFHFPVTRQNSRIEVLSASRDSTSQTIVFRVPVTPEIRDQINLKSGRKAQLIIAYSNSHDFYHHSARRTSTWITL